MKNNDFQIQPNADEIINILSQQIAQLSRDNAVLSSLVSQYQQEFEKLKSSKKEKDAK